MKRGFLPIALLFVVCGCLSQRQAPTPRYFREVTQSAGLTYRWKAPDKTPLNLRETIGNGCAFLDFNRDGSLDILFVGAPCGLFQGDGQGRFVAVALPELRGEFLGCAVGDYDRDGYPDLYLSAAQGGALLHNDSGKGFVEVTAKAGLAPQPWGTSCAWVETVPGSGRLDLFIANYVAFDTPGVQGARLLCDTRDAQGKSILAACGPREYEPLPAAFFQNLGQGRFQDASVSEGIRAQTHGRGLGVAAAYWKEPPTLGIAFANDESPGDLLVRSSSGSKSFTNQADSLGLAYDSDAKLHAGMGLDWGDYDNDGWLDLLVTTFRHEPTSLYRSTRGEFFEDRGYVAGLGAPTEAYVGFGCRFFDFDNDSWLDVALVNGHVQDNVTQLDAATRYLQPSQLFQNQQGRFREISTVGGTAFQKPILGRGLATGDFDNDGAVDLLLVDAQGEPLLLHNETPQRGHWLGVVLEGTKSNREGYGAQLTLTLGDGKKLVRHCHADGSYLSSSDPRVHFGLGATTAVTRLEIRWPSGKVQTIVAPPYDRYLSVREEP